MKGNDKELIKTISNTVTVPVVALGGAGSCSHLEDMYDFCKVRGLGLGSSFVYQNEMKGVLINFPNLKEKGKICE